MASPVEISFRDVAALERELRDNLERGGAFVAGQFGLAQDDECDVVLVHPRGQRLNLRARVVWLAGDDTDAPGIGLAFLEFDASLRDRLVAFVGCDEQTPEDESTDEERRKALSTHERLRGLTVAAQLKMAREGEINERTVLERLYGKTVWEAILRNPRVSLPEVARIARMGTLPRPQLELIAGNAAWLTSGQVRRALLQNHRLPRDVVDKVLRATPKHELKLIPKQTAYPHAVRDAARRLLGV
jgi:Tfp pilus assembly protein PilZ